MRILSEVRERMRAVLFRAREDRELDEELRFHVEMQTEENVRRGMGREEAGRQAVLAFGGLEKHREAVRAGWRVPLLEDLVQEARQAARRLARQPSFSVPALLTLALGLGVATAVFSVLHAVVLRPLPYPEADRLVRIQTEVPAWGAVPWNVAKAQFLHYREHQRSFEALGLYTLSATPVLPADPGRAAQLATTALVSADLLPVLGVRLALGRALLAEDNLAEVPAAVWLTHRYWVREMGADPGVVGRALRLDGRSVPIAGVLAPGAELPEELEMPGLVQVDLWAPLWLDPARPVPAFSHTFRALGRLRPDASLEQARREIAELTARLPAAYPEGYGGGMLERTGLAAALFPLKERVLGGVSRVLWILFGSVALLLLIACANAGGLFVVRAEARRRELAVRSAIGAARAHLLRHLLVETLLVALAAAALGLGLAHLTLRLLVRLAPPGIPRLAEVGLAGMAVGAAGLAALLIGLGFGLLPLLPREGGLGRGPLAAAGRGGTGSRRGRRLRQGLVVVQVALSLVLLAGAALLVRSARNLGAVPPGFDPRGVLTFRVELPPARYDSPEAAVRFYREAAARLEALPGVRSVGLTSALPLGGFDGCDELRAGGAEAEPRCVPQHVVSPGYFQALGIPLRGRAPGWDEAAAGGRVAVVSEALASSLWPGEDPIGRTLRPGPADAPFLVVGVAGDVRSRTLDRPPTEDLYLALGSMPWVPPLRFALRAETRRPESLLPAVRETLAGIDPWVPLHDARPMADLVRDSMSRLSLASLLVGVASGIALLLCLIGIYGVIAYLVAQRRREIGVRMALGAAAARVGREVMLQGVGLAGVGIGIGLVVALLATRLLGSLLFGVGAADAGTLAAAALALALAAALASLVPARRSTRIDPVEVLRHD
jgi:putative ABC transport system permease protein